MKIKLDENLGPPCVELLIQAGHDVATVASQGMQGATDRRLIDVCREEERCLVTLDLDFANPLTFPPQHYAGIAVLRLPDPITRSVINQAMLTLILQLSREAVHGNLWVVELGRIRVYKPLDPDAEV